MGGFIPGAWYKRKPEHLVLDDCHREWWRDQCRDFGYDETTKFQAASETRLNRPSGETISPYTGNFYFALDDVPLEDFL